MKKLYAMLASIALALLCTVNAFASEPDPVPTIRAGKVTAQAGGDAELPITLSDNPGLLGATVSVSYDSRLTLKEVNAGEALKGLAMTKPGDFSANPVRIVWIGIEPDDTNGTIASLVFTAPEEAGTYSVVISYEPGDIIDVDLNEADVATANGSVTVESTINENEQVSWLIESIENMDPGDRGTVEEIRWAYNNLTDAQKELIPEAALKKLTDAEDAFRRADEERQADLQAAAEVENAIDTMDPYSEESIGNARALYDALTDAQKELLSKEALDLLEAAEKALAEAKEAGEADKAAAAAVIEKIAALPEDPGADDKALVQSVRREYEKLTDVQKILVGPDNLKKLEAAEKKVNGGDPGDPGHGEITKIEDCEVFLDEQHFDYDGRAKEPQVTVRAGNIVLLSGRDYEAEYENNIGPGTAKVKITGRGDYSGSVELTFEIGPCVHEWDKGKITKEATCTEPGEKTYTCGICGGTKTEAVPTSGHSYKKKVKEASCKEHGYTTYSCQACGDTYKADYTEPLGHKFHAGAVAPTCTEQGYTEYTCEACGESYRDDFVAPGSHEYKTEVVEPTEKEKGYTIYICMKCGETHKGCYTEILGSEYKTEAVEPSCTERGYTLYVNLRTGEEHKEKYTDALGHDFVEETILPTCTERGYTIRTCDVCGYSYEAEFTDAAGHTFDGGAVIKDATADKNGIRTYTCLICGATKDEVIPATGHQYDGGTVTKEATCTEEGEITYACADCDAAYTEAAAPLGHLYTAVVTEPTCTEYGFTTFICDRCGDTCVDEYVEPAGHQLSESTTEAVCTEKGYTVYTCDLCGEAWTDNYVEAKGHSYKTAVTEPACTEKGYTEYTCEACGDSYTDDYTEALGHHYLEEKADPSCIEGGYILHTCEVCGDFYRDDYKEALGHSFNSVVTEPTCTEKGFTTFTCDRCGCSYADLYTAPSGHKYSSKVTEPTCTEEGFTLYTCGTCGDSYKKDFVKATGHTPSEVIFENIRDSADGISVFYDEVIRCMDCGNDISRKTRDAFIKNAKAVTCTEDGFTGNAYTADGAYLLREGMVKKTKGEHTWDAGRVTREATLTSEGARTHTCTVCGETKTESIPKIKPIDIGQCTISISDENCVYNGASQRPNVKVSYNGQTLKESDDYSYKVANNIHAGKGTVIFYGKGAYSGEVSRAFTIKKASQALNVSCASSVAAGKTVKITAEGMGTITYKSGSTKVAAVSSKGVVTGKYPGTVTIKVSAAGNDDYNAATKTLKITVRQISIKSAKVTLATDRVWTGSPITPAPTVKIGSKTLKKGTDYTLTYKANKNVGKASVVITGKGIYNSSITKTFKINPKGTTVSRINEGTKKLTVYWKKQASQTTGYQIQYSKVSSFKTQKTVTVSSINTVSKAISGLGQKSKYYVRIRTYRTVNGTKYYSAWSASKTATTK